MELVVVFLIGCFLCAICPCVLALPPDADSEIINLTMQSAQRTPQVKSSIDPKQNAQGSDGNDGIEPIRLVGLPSKGRVDGQPGAIGGRLGGLDTTLGRRGVRQLNDGLTPAIEPASSNGLSPSVFSRLLGGAAGGLASRLNGNSQLLGTSSNDIFSPNNALAAFLRQQRAGASGNGNGIAAAGSGQDNLAALQSLQREQQKVLQQQQQLALQLAVQQRAQRVQQQQQQQLQQLLAIQRGNGQAGRTVEVPGQLSPSNPNLGRLGRQLERPSSSGSFGTLNGFGPSFVGKSSSINPLANGAGFLPSLGGQSGGGNFGSNGLLGLPLTAPAPSSLQSPPNRPASSELGQEIASFLQALRQLQTKSATNPLAPSTVQPAVDPSSSSFPSSSSTLQSTAGGDPFKLLAEQQQQRALQQLLEQEQRILELERELRRNQLLENNRRDLQTVQDQQQRILTLLLSQQQQQQQPTGGEQLEQGRTFLLAGNGLANGQQAGGNVPSFGGTLQQIGQQPNLRRILNVGQAAPNAFGLPTTTTTDIQQQPLLLSSLSGGQQPINGQVPAASLDLGQLLQQLPLSSQSPLFISQQPAETQLQSQPGILSQFGQSGLGQTPIQQFQNIPSQFLTQLGQDGSASPLLLQPNLLQIQQQIPAGNDGNGQSIFAQPFLSFADGKPQETGGSLMIFQRGQPKKEEIQAGESQEEEGKEEEGKEEGKEWTS